MNKLIPIACLLPLCATAGLRAGEPALPAAAIDGYVARYVERGDFAGCVVIGRRGETLYERCFGAANRELGVAHTPRTRFRIGSLSKQFTATAVLVLEQQGKLSTADPVARHLPGYPRGAEITLHHLLTHTSGIPNALTLPGYAELKRRRSTAAELVQLFRGAPLDFEPGARHSYSNSGYMLLALLIERVSGLSYGEFLRHHVFLPAGMPDSGHEVAGKLLPGRASGYDPAGLQGVENAPFVDPSASIGAGSIYSTPQDLRRWNQALATDRPLSAASREKMLADHGHGYGYGLAVYRAGGRTVQAHDGRLPGFAADFSRYPDEGLVVVVLSNVQAGFGDAFRRDLRAIVFGDDYRLPELRRSAALAPSGDMLATLEGRYGFGPGLVVSAFVERQRLWVNTAGGEPSELVLLAEGTFVSRATYAHVDFETGDDGAVTAMIWIQDDNRFRGERLR